MAVALVRCSDYDPANLRASIRQAVNLLGGIEKFVRPGQRVLLKPNLLSPKAPESAVCTHPEIVLAVAELCLEAKAGEVVAGDSPGMGSARGVARKLGLVKQLDKLGVRLVEFTDPISIHQPGRPFPSFQLAREVMETDVLINLPKVKTHGQMVLTLATKNLYGTLVGMAKANWHLKIGHDRNRFALLILEIARAARPLLTIVDGVIGMEGNGPGNGDPRPLGAILAGTDTTAIDRVIAHLLGVDPHNVPTLVQAMEKGYGETDLASIELLGDNPALLRAIDWRLPPTSLFLPAWLDPLKGHLNRALSSHPIIRKERCSVCKVCINHCPPDAIHLEAGPKQGVAIDTDRCIYCFCCQELCPEGAIQIEEGWLVRLVHAVKKRATPA